MQLELPHVNVLSKMDLLKEKRSDVEQCAAPRAVRHHAVPRAADCAPTRRRFLQPDADFFVRELQHSMSGRYRRLNEAVAALVRTPSFAHALRRVLTGSAGAAAPRSMTTAW